MSPPWRPHGIPFTVVSTVTRKLSASISFSTFADVGHRAERPVMFFDLAQDLVGRLERSDDVHLDISMSQAEELKCVLGDGLRVDVSVGEGVTFRRVPDTDTVFSRVQYRRSAGGDGANRIPD